MVQLHSVVAGASEETSSQYADLQKKSAVACTRWVTFDRALARASLTEETMRQAILEMVRLAREPMLGLLLLGENKR